VVAPTPTDPDAPVSGPVRHEVRHEARHGARPGLRPIWLAATLVGVAAALVAVWFGTNTLMRSPGSVGSTLTTANQITVTPVIPLSREQIVDLLIRPPDYGGLRDPARRASCLVGLGYPAATGVLGARPIEMDGQSGVLLVLAGESESTLVGVAVSSACSAADTGLLADTTIPRAAPPSTNSEPRGSTG